MIKIALKLKISYKFGRKKWQFTQYSRHDNGANCMCYFYISYEASPLMYVYLQFKILHMYSHLLKLYKINFLCKSSEWAIEHIPAIPPPHTVRKQVYTIYKPPPTWESKYTLYTRHLSHKNCTIYRSTNHLLQKENYIIQQAPSTKRHLP